MKKFLISVLFAFSSLSSYAENVVGDPPIDESVDQITLEHFLQMPLRQVSQFSNERDSMAGLPNHIYNELQKIADSYNNRGKGILLGLISDVHQNSHYFCNLKREDFKNGFTYDPKNIRITCDDSFQTVINRLNELKLQKKDWEPKYTFSNYKHMTLLELAEKLQEGTETKEFDIEDLREDYIHFLTEEYGNLGSALTDQGVVKAVSICLLAKESGTINKKDVKNLCNLTVKEIINRLLE